jgi:hypothetical protein
MLGSLLPGLRELRAPLGAGALWLVTGFVAIRAMAEGEIEIRQFSPIVDIFSALGSSIDETWGAGVILSFTAFLIGALSHGFITDLLQSQMASVSDKGSRSIDLIARQRIGTLVDALDIVHLSKVRASTVDPELVSALEYAIGGGESSQGSIATHGETRPRKVDEKKERDFLIEKHEVELLKKRGDEWRALVRDHLEKFVPKEIENELPSVATRLIGKEQGLFDQYDRLRAESEFRLSLFPPMAALALTIAFVALPWISVLIAVVEFVILWYVAVEVYFAFIFFEWRDTIGPGVAVAIGVGVFLGGIRLFNQEIGEMLLAVATVTTLLGFAGAVLVQGGKIQTAAGDVLADAIFVRRVESPLLERLSAAIKPGATLTG